MPYSFCTLRPCLIYIPPPTGKPCKHNMTDTARYASNSLMRIIASGKRRMSVSPVSRKPPLLTPLLKTLSDLNRFSRLLKGSFFLHFYIEKYCQKQILLLLSAYVQIQLLHSRQHRSLHRSRHVALSQGRFRKSLTDRLEKSLRGGC